MKRNEMTRKERLRPLIATIAVSLCLQNLASALASDEENCLYGCPTGASAENRKIERNLYSMSHNPETKIAEWVAYRVDVENLKGPKRSRSLKRDPMIHNRDLLTYEDYRDAFDLLGYNKGHLMPLGSVSNSPHWETVNFFSNIAPQTSSFNQGPWQKLEEKVRRLALERSETTTFVMTGPMFETQMDRLPSTTKSHVVPSAFWKIVVIVDNETLLSSGFILPQDTAKKASFCQYQETIEAIERRSGLDFFPEIGSSKNDRAAPTSSGFETLPICS